MRTASKSFTEKYWNVPIIQMKGEGSPLTWDSFTTPFFQQFPRWQSEALWLWSVPLQSAPPPGSAICGKSMEATDSLPEALGELEFWSWRGNRIKTSDWALGGKLPIRLFQKKSSRLSLGQIFGTKSKGLPLQSSNQNVASMATKLLLKLQRRLPAPSLDWGSRQAAKPSGKWWGGWPGGGESFKETHTCHGTVPRCPLPKAVSVELTFTPSSPAPASNYISGCKPRSKSTLLFAVKECSEVVGRG